MYYESYKPSVIYSPKKAVGFGQNARLKDLKLAWQQTQDFLQEFTLFQPMRDIKLMVCDGDSIQEAEKLFGEISVKGYWKLTLNQLPLASEFALRKHPNSSRYEPAVELFIFYRFIWKDFAAENVKLPDDPEMDYEWRSYSSNMGLYLSQHRLFIQPTLMFPCSWQDERFVKIINKIKDKVPFELKRKNFGGTKMPKADWYEILRAENNQTLDWFK
ncbi:hypothetical protein ENHYD8BJ_90451 [Enhydrobacter sp. 8BJ]|nr:hypothetical protein [Enhydrobacter sp. 8BJ]VXB90892.1 hypothetical protein ENHYD8BJ_90451 [Enhydrobacter sp. 8BJ]